MGMKFDVLLSAALKGESPVWDDRRNCVFFVDMGKPAVNSVRLDGSEFRSWPVPELAGSIGLGESGNLIVSQPKSLLVLNPETGRLRELVRVEGEPPENRLNDGKTGPDGAFWVGSMDTKRERRESIGSLFRVTGDGRITRVIERGMFVSNGLAWSPDHLTMYHSDSAGPWINRYDFSPATGGVTNPTRFAELSEQAGRPDGAACDIEGRYWSAGVSAGVINVFSPTGTILKTYPTEVTAPTMPAFCGENLDYLVVTSLPDRPNGRDIDGSLMIAKTDTRGAPVSRWKDR